MRSWHLPEEFAILIERHPSLEELLASNPPNYDASCVALASLLPACKDQDWRELNEFINGIEKLLPGSASNLESILEQTDKQFTDFAPMMKLPCPPTSLVAALKAQQEAEAEA